MVLVLREKGEDWNRDVEEAMELNGMEWNEFGLLSVFGFNHSLTHLLLPF